MDVIVDALSTAYDNFVNALAALFEAKQESGGKVTAATNAALNDLHQKRILFLSACDQAEHFVESVKLRIGSEGLKNEATSSVDEPYTPGLSPNSEGVWDAIAEMTRSIGNEFTRLMGAEPQDGA